jgi:hypothetical protein
MYGHYSIPDPDEIPNHFKSTLSGDDLKPRYNAARSENLPVIVNDSEVEFIAI